MYVKYKKYIDDLDKFYDKSNIFKEENYVLESGHTMLVEYYKVQNHPNITKATIYNRMDKNLIELKRNYSNFPFTCIRHSNAFYYLICGEEYQGFTVLNLETFKKNNHTSLSCYKRKGFCPYEWTYEKINNMLYVVGCDYFGEEKNLSYDFEFPDAIKLHKYRV